MKLNTANLIALAAELSSKYGSSPSTAITIHFMSLAGPFKKVKEQSFPSLKEALEAVKEYAAHHNFTNVQLVQDADADSIRFTARTPNGRGGRNIAFGEYDLPDAPDEYWWNQPE